jgi:uncharacterized damage-inducible protein DinB
MEDILDSWDIHNQMLFLLYDRIEPDYFSDKPFGKSGRTISNIFAHVNNLRVSWIESSAPALVSGLIKIPLQQRKERDAVTKESLRPALVASTKGMYDIFRIGLDGGKLKNLKPHLTAKFSFYIAHEWYHIGEVCMILTLSGHKLDDDFLENIWSWGRWAVDMESVIEKEA